MTADYGMLHRVRHWLDRQPLWLALDAVVWLALDRTILHRCPKCASPTDDSQP